MSELLPQVDAWVKVAVALLVALGAFLVPVNGWFKEYWAYKVRVREIEPLQADTARNISGLAIGDSLASADLARAIDNLAAAIRADTASDEQLARDEVSKNIKALTDRLSGPAASSGA